MKLFNTKSNKLEQFVPIQKDRVSMYVCGPTVHNHAHIGNARPMVIFDTLKKTLEALGYVVEYVSNYTDVEDKIINKAVEEQVSEEVITARYIAAYEALRTALGVQVPDANPRVTENMAEIIDFINELIDAGSAYVSAGDVYFSVDSITNYGSLSHQNLEDLVVGARIEENTKKRNPLDFTLWKTTEQGVHWKAPWSKGRPGWHTECVVMINEHFKQDTIDIHGGGQDLKFPHHENENAQQMALHHTDLANYWMHNAMVHIDGDEMHKSLGNAVDAKTLIEQLGRPVVRWLLIRTHYRQTLNLSEQTIAQAQTEINRMEQALRGASVLLQREGYKTKGTNTQQFYPEFLEAMRDDMNTPNAIKVLFDGLKALNAEMRTREINLQSVDNLVQELCSMLNILGIELNLPILSENDIGLFYTWDEAKKEKNFELADSLRAELQQRGLL